MEFTLRAWTPDDLDSLIKYANNFEIAKNMTDQFPHPYTIAKGKAFIEHASSGKPTNIFAIVVDNKAVGAIGIHPQSDIQRKNAEMGYWLAQPFWGNGIITKAIIQMTDYAKQNMNERLELKLVFPKKEKFILAEMGMMFITSVILILLVLGISWRTIFSLMKEKKISEHTRDFLNNMTHEFKTPLTNISLAGKMILKESNINQSDKVKHYSGIILAENEKLRQEVEQVLNMTALEKGEIPLQKSNLDFHQLIRDSLKSISIQIENKKGVVTLELNAIEHVMNGDKPHLSNAICNLIDNALKYSGTEPQLTIQTSNVNQNIVFEISDQGIGIDKEYQQKVFEKFFRVPTHDIHDAKGFGIGLAYVKRIIELHGGTIELRSEKEKGSTFKITLAYV